MEASSGRRLQDRRRPGRRVAALIVALAGFGLAASDVAATTLISEVFYDASGSDDGRVFVELSGIPGTELDGMRLEGVNGSNGAVGPIIELTGTIADDGLFVIADWTSEGTSEVGLADLLANFDFQNGPDSVMLWDGDVVLDAVGYGIFDVDEIFAGEGAPVEDPPAGWSVARVFADVDTDDNSLDFVALEMPTPGAAEFAAVPEPSTALLVAAGVGTMGWLRRRRPSDASPRCGARVPRRAPSGASESAPRRV